MDQHKTPLSPADQPSAEPGPLTPAIEILTRECSLLTQAHDHEVRTSDYLQAQARRPVIDSMHLALKVLGFLNGMNMR